VQRATTTPEEERRKDVWDLAVLGLSRRLDFTPISQAWLRETAKRWAGEELPQHRGRQAAKVPRDTVGVVGQLSACLRETRPDHGEDPAALSRRDVIAFTNRLAHHERAGTISANMRVLACRDARRFLADIRSLGLTRPGGLAAGLPDDFIMGRQDIPSEPDPDEQGRDLPAWVLQILDAHLHVLEQRSGTDMRRMTELMIDTGRRPDEICQLRLDCVARDAHSKPVLIYTDAKNHRPHRRLPIAEATARIIASQQADARARFPGTPARDLPLFPRDRRNPRGTATYAEPAFTNTHRQWVNSIAHLLVTTVTGADGTPREQVFDRLAVIPYAYRHSYAQRHADEGISPDVLRDLLKHVSIRMTEHYAKVATSEIEDILQHIWVAGPAAPNPGELLWDPATPMDRRQAEALMIDLSRASTPTEGGFCTYQPVVHGGACPWNLNCHSCDKFVLSGADLLYWRRKREQWASIAERAPDDATADYLHQVFAPTAQAIDGLEKALAGLGLLDQALALDLRRPQDYYHRLWNMSFRATDLAAATGSEAEEEGR
jgi:integrase